MKITNEMKKSCIGEFTFTRENACVSCYLERDKNCEICNGEIEYIETITVPWDTCKQIYKKMVQVAGG
jgi:hypothetical protein